MSSAPDPAPGHSPDQGQPTVRPFSIAVDPAWLDYNGHMTDSAYAVIAAAANESWCVDVDLGEAYRQRTGNAVYTAQLTVRYLHEISADEEISVVRKVERLGTSSLTLSAQLVVHGRVVAETEHVYVHVDSAAGVSTPFTDGQRALLTTQVGLAV